MSIHRLNTCTGRGKGLTSTPSDTSVILFCVGAQGKHNTTSYSNASSSSSTSVFFLGHFLTPSHQSTILSLNLSVSFLGHRHSLMSSPQQRDDPSTALSRKKSKSWNKQIGQGGIILMRHFGSKVSSVGHLRQSNKASEGEERRRTASRDSNNERIIMQWKRVSLWNNNQTR